MTRPPRYDNHQLQAVVKLFKLVKYPTITDDVLRIDHNPTTRFNRDRILSHDIKQFINAFSDCLSAYDTGVNRQEFHEACAATKYILTRLATEIKRRADFLLDSDDLMIIQLLAASVNDSVVSSITDESRKAHFASDKDVQ